MCTRVIQHFLSLRFKSKKYNTDLRRMYYMYVFHQTSLRDDVHKL